MCLFMCKGPRTTNGSQNSKLSKFPDDRQSACRAYDVVEGFHLFLTHVRIQVGQLFLLCSFLHNYAVPFLNLCTQTCFHIIQYMIFGTTAVGYDFACDIFF